MFYLLGRIGAFQFSRPPEIPMDRDTEQKERKPNCKHQYCVRGGCKRINVLFENIGR